MIVALREYEGTLIIDMRRHYTAADGKLRPTSKGLALTIAKLPELAAALRARLVGHPARCVGSGLDRDNVPSAPSLYAHGRQPFQAKTASRAHTRPSSTAAGRRDHPEIASYRCRGQNRELGNGSSRRHAHFPL